MGLSMIKSLRFFQFLLEGLLEGSGVNGLVDDHVPAFFSVFVGGLVGGARGEWACR